MLETVQATADLPLVGDPYDLAQQLSPHPKLWRRIGANQARFHDDASALGSLVLRRAAYGEQAGYLQLVFECNLTAIMYGKVGKALTLPPVDVKECLLRAISETQKALPTVAPRTLEAYRCSRVDASVTWALQPGDGALLVQHMRDAFFSLQGNKGRWQASQPGPASFMLQASKEDKVRFYDKTAEAVAKGSPLPTHLQPNRANLYRLESQIVARTARARYGDNLANLVTDGVTVATTTLATWLETFGSTATGRGSLEVFRRLVNGGMPTDRAMLLTGPATLLRTAGVDGLIAEGIKRRTAYAWRAEISKYVPDEQWGEVLAVPLTFDDAVYADAFCERIA